jgi:hypothetical protein
VGVVEFKEWPHSGVPVRIKIDLTTSNSKAHERQKIVRERIKKGMRRTEEKESSRRRRIRNGGQTTVDPGGVSHWSGTGHRDQFSPCVL